MKRRIPSLGVRLYFASITLLGFTLSTLISFILYLAMNAFKITLNVSPLIWIFVFSIVFATVFSALLSRILAKPIEQLCDAMKKVASGDFKVRLKTNRHVHEMNDIYNNFNLMAEGLDSTEILQSDFVSNVSHEFKTPINAIEGYSMLLQGEQSEEEKKRYIEKILFNTRRLSTLVGNILLLSKVDNQVIKSKQSKFSLDEQIRQAILLLEQEWTKKDIEFDVDMEPINYFGPEDLLLHVWTNLLGNAIKFDPHGGIIKIRLFKKDNSIVFAIDDNGPGIPEIKQNMIFNKFYQCDSSHKEEGNGLGLALVKRILDSCGGNIETENLEIGCRFTVTLPE